MNRLNLFISVAVLFFAASCSKEIGNNTPPVNKKSTESEYLKFGSQEELTDLLKKYIAAETGEILTKGISIGKRTENFVSIAESDKEQQRLLTRSRASSDESTEEMTQDEFNIMKAKLLLPDPALHNIFDTTLRVVVGDDFYKITSHGTFFTKTGNEDELYEIIANFEQFKNNMPDTDSIVSVSPNVKFINSFNGMNLNNVASENGDTDFDTSEPIKTKSMSNNWISEYGLKSYVWEPMTVVGKLLADIFGKDVYREHNFSSDKRVQLNVFKVNYRFYKSTGIKVKMEKRKKFCFIPYWVDEYADDIAIGFEKFGGTLTLTRPIDEFTPLLWSRYNDFSGYFNGIYKRLIYQGLGNLGFLNFVRDWTSDLFSWFPEVLDYNDKKKDEILRNTSDAFVKAGVEAVCKEIRTQFVNRYVFDPIKETIKQGQIKEKTPIALHTLWGAQTTKVYMTGIQNYGRSKNKTIRFDTSFGITINVMSSKIHKMITGFTPSQFTIDEMDMFGAAYYNGQWKGIRMYYNGKKNK